MSIGALTAALIGLELLDAWDALTGSGLYDVPPAFLQGVFALLMLAVGRGIYGKIKNGKGEK